MSGCFSILSKKLTSWLHLTSVRNDSTSVEDVDCIELHGGRIQWWTLVNTELNLRIP